MKQYIDAKLAIVSVNQNNVIATSGRFGGTTSTQLAGDRFRDFEEDYSY